MQATADRVLRLANHHHNAKAAGDCRILKAQPLELVRHRDLESRAEAMQEDGFVAFPDVLNEAQVRELRAKMESIGEADETYYQRGHYGRSAEDGDAFRTYNKHIGKPFTLDASFLQYFDKPEVLEVVEAIHGPNCRVIGGSVWVTGAGRYPMGLHIDYQPIALPEDIALDRRVHIPIFISTAHYYLNDMYDELGPTVIVPGSHRAGRAPNGETSWRGQEAQSFLCNAGDVLLFRSDLWHGALPNVSDERRYMLQVHYGNLYMDFGYASPFKGHAVPPEILAQANPVQRRLMGERAPGGAQGSYIKEPIRLDRRGRDAKRAKA